MSYDPVGSRELAAVVTFLEMRERPSPSTAATSLSLRQVERPDLGYYRELFRLVGARWLWFSRLVMDDAKLAAIIQHEDVKLFVVKDELGRDAGMIELDFREPSECELAFIGLVPELSGKGHGKWLLAEAVQRAWRDGVTRVHVHTCSLDHPAALSAYRRAGFMPFKRAIERFPDPRLLGFLSRDCAPQIPLIDA
ncbi:MAG TPA: GNAT family N-acetyltransferase [Sphingomicrobium sp.]